MRRNRVRLFCVSWFAAAFLLASGAALAIAPDGTRAPRRFAVPLNHQSSIADPSTGRVLSVGLFKGGLVAHYADPAIAETATVVAYSDGSISDERGQVARFGGIAAALAGRVPSDSEAHHIETLVGGRIQKYDVPFKTNAAERGLLARAPSPLAGSFDDFIRSEKRRMSAERTFATRDECTDLLLKLAAELVELSLHYDEYARWGDWGSLVSLAITAAEVTMTLEEYSRNCMYLPNPLPPISFAPDGFGCEWWNIVCKLQALWHYNGDTGGSGSPDGRQDYQDPSGPANGGGGWIYFTWIPGGTVGVSTCFGLACPH
jgi:hypothetical protein